jgi:hypothetical protein
MANENQKTSPSLHSEPVKFSKWIWVGRGISPLLILMLTMSAVMKFVQPAGMAEGFTKLGYPMELAFGLGMVEIICVILYAIPRSSVLGAILLTGYLGGAISTHLRVGDPIIAPIILGVLVWVGLYLRDSQVRNLIPIRM